MSVRGDPGLTSLAPRAPPGRPRRAARSVDRARVFLSNAFASPARKDRRRSRPADPLPRRALSSPQGGKAEEVTWEDQQHICAFGRFNTRVHEVNAELRAKAVRARNQRLVSRRFVFSFFRGLPVFASVETRGRVGDGPRLVLTRKEPPLCVSSPALTTRTSLLEKKKS